MGMGLLALTLVVFSIVYVYLWITQLVQLMVFRDNDFPGRNDKTLWLIIYIAFIPLSPFILMWWKSVYLHVQKMERNE